MSYIYVHKEHKLDSYSMVNLHSHPHYEIYYLVEGDRLFFFSDHMHKITGPTIIIVPPYATHKTEGNAFMRYNIYVSPKYFNNFQKKTITDKTLQVLMPSETENEELKNIFERFIKAKKSNHRDEITEALFAYFIVLLSGMNTNEAPNTTSVNTKANPTVLKVISYLNKHYNEKITLEDLSEKFFISKATLNYSFKTATASSPIEYLLNIRLAKAKELLIESSKNINQISNDCGFSSPNYFGLIFKKKESMSPATFRKMYR